MKTDTNKNVKANTGLSWGRLWLAGWLAVAVLLVGRALWSPGPEPPAVAGALVLDAASEQSRLAHTFRPIEDLRVGDRVIADNPDTDTPAETAVDSDTWRLIKLYAEERWADGTLDTIHVETLQPPEWVELWEAQVGAEVPPPLDLVEMGLPEDLLTRVVANEPCPPLQPPLAGDDPGRLVLTTVNHLNNDVWELSATPVRGPPVGSAAVHTLRPTGMHKFYSETRSDWVLTKDIQDREVIRGRAGPLKIVAKRQLPGVERVYNLTVEGEHVYYVSELGLLAHNQCNEKFYRAVSEAEYRKIVENEGLTRRTKGSSELGITEDEDYVRQLVERRRGSRKYPLVVEFEVSPGTRQKLIEAGAAHPSVHEAGLFPELPSFTSGMSNPQIKLEERGVLSILLGSSDEAVDLFNSEIQSFRLVK